MKQKLLLVLGFLLVTLGLQAENTATLSFADKAQRTTFTSSQQVWEQNGIKLTNDKASSTNAVGDYAKPARFYANSKIIVEYGSPIIKIEFNCNSTSYATALKNSIGTTATVTVDAKKVTAVLPASATRFEIAKLTAQVRMDNLVVYYVEETGGEEEPTAPVAPELTASRKFLEKQEVVISCSTEGAKIYYTTDGTNPTAESTEYSEPFTVTKTTTVKAIAVNENGSSEVATATYTKGELMTIAQAKAAGKGEEVFIDLKDVVVTVNHSNGYYIFIQDETTGICIFSSGAKYAAGTQFTAGVIYGTTDVYNNMNQIKNAEFIDVETTTTTVEPIEVTVADLADADKYATYEGRYVKLTDVTLAGTAITQGEATYTAYDRFELGFETEYAEATTCNIEGIPACYKTTLQIYPVVIEPHVHSASAFTVEGASIKAACDCGLSYGSLTLVVPSDLVYNGQAKEVTVEGSIEGMETPAVVYSCGDAPINAGTYTASITLGDVTATVEYTIAALDIAGAVVGEFAEMTYTGAAQTPAAVVTIEGVGEVTGSWSEVLNVGDKSTFTANGNFAGSLEAEVGMKAKELEESDIVLEAETVEYTGEAIEPVVTVTSGDATLVEGTDYVVTYNNNVEVGEATITVTAMGNYSGTFVVKFVITQPTTIAPVQSQTEVVYYDLCGRRVQQPLKGKIYIANGKKVIF